MPPFSSPHRTQGTLSLPLFPEDKLSEIEFTPLRITLAYVFLGFIALYVSDVLLVQYVSEPLLSRVQALKGGVEILLTGGLILGLTATRESQLQDGLEQMKRQREELLVLHRVLRHNLRNDLNVILGYTDLIREAVGEHEFSHECEIILETVEEMNHYTRQAARIRRVTESKDELRHFNVNESIQKVLMDLSLPSDDVRVTTTIPHGTHIEANVVFLEVLRELISNAIEHNDSMNPAVDIDVRPHPDDPSTMQIRIADNGPGIPERELQALQAGEESPLTHLSGVGLWFVDWAVRHSDGELNFEENQMGGTTVILYLRRV